MISVFFMVEINSTATYTDLDETTFFSANITSGGNEDASSSSSSSLALQAFILVVTISVPVILFIVVIFCSPSSKRRIILNALANNRHGNQNGGTNRIGVQNNQNNEQPKTTVDMMTMVNGKETVVLSNYRISTY